MVELHRKEEYDSRSEWSFEDPAIQDLHWLLTVALFFGLFRPRGCFLKVSTTRWHRILDSPPKGPPQIKNLNFWSLPFPVWTTGSASKWPFSQYTIALTIFWSASSVSTVTRWPILTGNDRKWHSKCSNLHFSYTLGSKWMILFKFAVWMKQSLWGIGYEA